MSLPSLPPSRQRLLSSCLLAVVLFWACGAPDAGMEEERPGDEAAAPVAESRLGTVSFATSCGAEVQEGFEQAVAMLHSFWFAEADAAFREVAERDPECAMAQWGIAMTAWGNPMARAAPSQEQVERADEALRRAEELREGITHREGMYLDAAAALYEGDGTHLQRMAAHEDAMDAIVRAHPDDDEATIFYGRIMVANAPPDDLSFSRQLEAAEMMEPLFDRRPNHPGLAHYLIHAYDAPPLAERGEEAAFRYAEIAPDAPHALHMPSHIFTRRGYWEESVETNARSASASPAPDAAVHPLDYMVYAYLQRGMDDAASEVVERTVTASDEFYGGLLTYNFAAMRARLALERNRWEDAARLPLPDGDAPAFAEAVTRFARGLGAARTGDARTAAAESEALAALRDRARSQGDEYWPTVMEAQRLAVSAWEARARGDDAEAVRLARAAADLEETVEKHPVTPGPLLPARELLGDLLLELERPSEALEAYEATLEEESGRARALYGAARAAEAAGNASAADAYYRSLLELLEDADPDRPDLRAAVEWSERS